MCFSLLGIMKWAGLYRYCQFCISNARKNRAAKHNTAYMQESVSNSFYFIPLEILLADNDILMFRGFNKWRPDSLCYSFPVLRAVRNNKV